MANMHIRSSECAWHHSTVNILGRNLVGITAWEFKKEVEKTAEYGAGQKAIDIQEGPEKCSGSITVFGYELDKMEQAAKLAGYDSLLHVPHEAIILTVAMRKTLADPITTITARGVSFTETTDGMGQGDKKRECPLPFICLDIDKNTISL